MSHTHINVSMFDTEVTASWAAHINRVCVEVRSRDYSLIGWQQSVEEATALRDQLTDAIEAAQAAGGAR